MMPVDDCGDLPPAAYAAALASLPGVGPAWLFDLLAAYPPRRGWERVLAGEINRPVRGKLAGKATAWAEAARSFDVGRMWSHCIDNRIAVAWPDAPGYPHVLARGPAPVGVLFVAGDISVLEGRPAVAVVGTRRCTPEGAAVAYQLGYDLAAAGVCVVSGLALGVDGAAHAGALAAVGEHDDGAGSCASTVGVAASGVDVIYPRQHAAMWRQVVRAGAVISETPPSVPAQAWRFPSRNRVIAALAQMVVVVECHAAGGSWHTVEAALRRGTEVGVVPGPVHSSASVGTNTLLHEGATPVRGAQDVLDALGLFEPQRGTGPSPARPHHRGSASAARSPRAASSPRPGSPAGPAGGEVTIAARGRRPGPVEVKVLGAVGWHPVCLEDIVERSGLPTAAVIVALDRLEEDGAIAGEAGWWCRRSR
jgi:DNA processing protein